jgi:hypothetical protein
MKKHIIWSSTINFEDWEDDLKEKYPNLSEDKLYDIAVETNDEYLNDERANLNIKCEGSILLVGDIGRWDGRSTGYRVIESGNIADCLESQLRGISDLDIYLDERGDLRADETHHDGTNHYLFRSFKPSATQQQIENLKDKIYCGNATRADIVRLTDRLGDKIAAVHGWDIPKQKTRTPQKER